MSMYFLASGNIALPILGIGSMSFIFTPVSFSSALPNAIAWTPPRTNR